MLPGITNVGNVQLIGKGALTALVKQRTARRDQRDGRPGLGVSRTTRSRATEPAARSPQNIFAGPYAVCGSVLSGPTTIFGRAGTTVVAGLTSTVIVTLGPAAKIRGTFVQRDLVTPVGFAQVAVGSIGFATTDAAGKFEVAGIPLGTYRLVTQNPVTGIGAIANVTLSVDGETRDAARRTSAAKSRACDQRIRHGLCRRECEIALIDGLTPERGDDRPDGAPAFPARRRAALPSKRKIHYEIKGNASGTLGKNVSALRTDVPLQPLARPAGTVRAGRRDPATNPLCG